jgi:hypothetical protein
VSYNIDSILTIYQSGFGFGPTYDELAAKHQRDAPTLSVFDNNWNVTQPFWWNGERSGSSFEALLEVLASFEGEIDLVLIWEGGDSIDGLRLRNHKVTRHRVLCSLGEEIS